MISLVALWLGFTGGLAVTDAQPLVIGTWNLEWLMTPETFDQLAPRCLADGRRARGNNRSIPCNIVPKLRWSAADLERLRDFAAGVAPDVVALQEIDGAAAAQRIFPGHDFCFTSRAHVQNVGFAIRRGIPHRCNRDYRALGLPDNSVRWGADLTLYPGSQGELRLLAVHLKSGCNRDPLSERRRDCHRLQDQVPVLERWIDRQARAGTRFAVLGDFNRRFDVEPAAARNGRGETVAMWPELDDGDPPEADLVNAGPPGVPIACQPGERARTPIDHIVLSRRLAGAMVPESRRVWAYPDRARWPDHCLITIELQPGDRHGL